MSKPILLIGNVLVDVTLAKKDIPLKMRLGGIVHAARCLWAMGAEYHVAFYAPSYLIEQAINYLNQHGAKLIVNIGEVIGAPNVVLIGDVTEAGNQGYEVLLREEKRVLLQEEKLRSLLESNDYSDIIIFPEISDPEETLKILLAQKSHKNYDIHIDANNVPDIINRYDGKENCFDLFFLSTSSPLIMEFNKNIIKELASHVLRFSKEFIIKENRGGTRVYFQDQEVPLMIPCFPRETTHSVGVGDCYNVSYIFLRTSYNKEVALRMASLFAACYAATTYVDDFRDDIQRHMMIAENIIVNMKGIILPWELRQTKDIYIAGPDFDYVEKEELDSLVNCLKYHNFKPRLPIRENGQAGQNFTDGQKRLIFMQDISLMDECKLMLAVMLYSDQGTLVEIGMARQKGIPIIVYDPKRIADNLFLQNTVNIITHSEVETIDYVFKILSNQLGA